MGKARRFDSYSNDVDNERNISQLYGQARQNLSGVGSSFRSSPLGVNTVSGNPTITSAGDNLGNHTATQDLNLAGNDIILSSDGDTKFNVVGATVLFMCSNSGSSTEVFRISATELQMAQNIDLNTNDIQGVDTVSFNASGTDDATIDGSTTGLTHNVATGDVHTFQINSDTKLQITNTAINVYEDIDSDSGATFAGSVTINGAVALGNASTDLIFASGRFNTSLIPNTDNDVDLGSSTNAWRHLYVDGTANLDTVSVTGGKKVKASNSTEIAFQVTDNSLTVGTKGTMEIPYVFDTNSLSTGTNTTLDGYFGDNNGCIGIQFDTDASAGTGKYRLWVRADGGWYKMEAY